MSKKKVFFLSYFVFAMSLFSNFVSAAGLQGAFDTMHRLFGFLPDLITLDKLIGQDAATVFWAKFLVWVLLFAILYFGTTAIPRLADNKRIATTIALTISLISVFLMPNEIITSIFTTYGLVAGILLWFIPLTAALYLNHKIKVRWLRVLLLLIALIVLMNIDATVHAIFPNPDWADYFSLLLAIVILMFFWNLFAALFGEGGAEGPRGWAGDGIRNAWNNATRPRDDGGPEGERGWGRDGIRNAWDWATRPREPGRREPGRRGPGPGGGGGPRPPGPLPSPTPPRRHPTDPPMPPGAPPPGLNPHAPGPKIIPPKVPKKPKIPDEQILPIIDLSEHFNPIRCQDSLGACSAFAATSIFEYILHTGYGMQKRKLSPLFLWYKTRETIGVVNVDDGPNTCAVPMMNLIKDGVCFEELWEFAGSSDPKWKMPPDKPAVVDAAQKKLIKFGSLDKNDPDQWVHALLQGYPINIGVIFPKDMFKDPPYNYKNRKLYDNFGKRENGGGHAMVIVGYHSHYPYMGRGIKAFKIRNSHDVDWGENGYTWVPAEILKDMMFEDPIIIMGWKKDSYNPQEKTGHKPILEKIKTYAEWEKEWLAAEYKFLDLLKGHIYEERYQEANKIMTQVGRSERKSFYFEKQLDENLSELIKVLQEPYKSSISTIKYDLVKLSKKLLVLTSRREGLIKQKIELLVEDGPRMEPKAFQNTVEATKNLVGTAIQFLRGIETELSKLIDIEDVLDFEQNAFRDKEHHQKV